MKPRLIARPQDLRDERLAPTIEQLAAGNSEHAFASLHALSDRYSGAAVVAELLGMLYYDSGRIDEACRHLTRASAAAAGVSAYAYNEACALLLAGRPEDAFSGYRRSLRGDEILVDAHRWAWSALAAEGRLDSALRRFREALRQSPVPLPQAPPGLRLDDVTLCIVDCVDPALAVRSLRSSTARARFGAVRLLTSRACRFDGVETSVIAPISSKEEYSRFVMKSLAGYIDTRHALVTQWDSHVVNAEAWSPKFLEFDYVGGTWDDGLMRAWGGSLEHNVGNGGFSLRSRRFLAAGLDPRIVKIHAEDAHLCRTYRPLLEAEYGIRFADTATANAFSFEANVQEATPFGFHGAFNVSVFEPDPRFIRFDFLDDNGKLR